MAINDSFEELSTYLEQTRSALNDAVTAVSPDLRQIRPSAESWSIAEVVEHLALIEMRIARLLSALATKARESGTASHKAPESIVGSIDRALIADRSRKIAARDGGLPTGGQSAAESLRQLEAAREQLLKTIEAVKQVDLTDAFYPHPAFGALNAYQWLAFVGAHEERHTKQIVEIADALSRSV